MGNTNQKKDNSNYTKKNPRPPSELAWDRQKSTENPEGEQNTEPDRSNEKKRGLTAEYETHVTKKVKAKSPSRRARDNRRLTNWLQRKINTEAGTEERSTQTTNPNNDSFKSKSTQFNIGDLNCQNHLDPIKIAPTTTGISTASQKTETSSLTKVPQDEQLCNKTKNINPKHPYDKTTSTEKDRNEAALNHHTYNQVNPNNLYQNLEINLTMTRLEETKNLTKALRYVVRHQHIQGKTVRFPSPEAVDRLELKIAGLPTNSTELWTVIQKVFQRREEDISLQDLYADFVTTHGRKAFDPAKTSSDCFYISYNP